MTVCFLGLFVNGRYHTACRYSGPMVWNSASVMFLKICYLGRQWDLIWCNDTLWWHTQTYLPPPQLPATPIRFNTVMSGGHFTKTASLTDCFHELAQMGRNCTNLYITQSFTSHKALHHTKLYITQSFTSHKALYYKIWCKANTLMWDVAQW